MDPSFSGEYRYVDEASNPSHRYLFPALARALQAEAQRGCPRSVFEVGCGNGSTAAFVSALGFSISGIDPSNSGIQIAQRSHPNLRLEHGSAYDDLAAKYGRFPVVISLEVVEHVYSPRDFAKSVYSLLDDGGLAIISTPYHGYLKNLALAVSGKLDSHFTALWDGGHIKFWSRATLRELLLSTGFRTVEFVRVGRIAPLAKSMIALARR